MRSDSFLIPFGGFPSSFLDKAKTDLLSKIIQENYIQFSDLVRWASSKGWFTNEEALATELSELSWHGVITIEGMDREKNFWRVRSTTS